MIVYVKHFDSNKTMFFKVGDNKLFKKCNSNLMNMKFDSEPVYVKYIKPKIKMYEDRVNTNFQGKKVAKKMLHINA